MRILFVICIALLFTNCHRYVIPQASTRSISVDTITIKSVPYDSTITIPGSAAMFVFPLPLIDSPYEASQKTEGKEAIIKARDGKLVVACKDDSLQHVITLLRQEVTQHSYQGKDSIITIVQTVTVTRTSSTTWLSLVLNVIMLVLLVFKAKSTVVNPLTWIINLFK